ncbi:WRKY transcription factor 71-like [Triticum urartu]|uniref:WRKY transcription factor 71-like n=1 Tax=Triticum urartu TaxID=4572 RepID=UPI0020430F71|nr:WRKY transcription factor 71-like [Triticum urartu]
MATSKCVCAYSMVKMACTGTVLEPVSIVGSPLETSGELSDIPALICQRLCQSAKKEQEKKGKGEKKARGSRVAFATKSEVDHLDDGYRWRKYGQKAVKNSSFPRSYYRCTAAQCGVKKLVERSQQDPSTVVTTYEGRHGHPSPIIAHHGARMLMATSADTAYSLAALQHHQHGFFPTGTDVYTSSVAHRVSEYGGIQFHDDLLPDATMGYQQGYR